jgi:hypothetical protein
MNIAVLGWGSLIWCPGNLKIKSRWRLNGPALPIEFARISQDGRLTLVIHPGSADQPTYWALSEFTTVDQARTNLGMRENSGSAHIHYILRSGNSSDGAPEQIVDRVRQWLKPRRKLQAAIWTGLTTNWTDKRRRDFATGDAIDYLMQMETDGGQTQAAYRAREYLTNAPPLINTAVRAAMRARGWKDASLPAILFESPRRSSKRKSA